MLRIGSTRQSGSSMLHRRDFLQVGALGVGGLALPELLRLRAASSSRGESLTRPKAVIMICLAGGPSHLDMYDLKPNAPVEFRGEFKPIRSNVPGFDLCELMPLQASIADRLALLRTIQFVEPMQHELEEVFTGFPKSFKRPSFGSVVSRFSEKPNDLPSYVSLEYGERTASYESPQYLGAKHAPFQISGTSAVRSLSLPWYMPKTRFEDRNSLIRTFDTYRKEIDKNRESQDLDEFQAKALDLITSAKAREAFDLSREPSRVLAKYGQRDDKYIYVGTKADSVWDSHKFLLARRLVEAGIPVVTMRVASWDHHGNVVSGAGGTIFQSLRSALPLLDRSVHALVTDLQERGLDKEVMVVLWGEFGRTPRIVQNGRDHWPDVGFALFAGAVKTGQVIGETDRKGEAVKNRAVSAQNVLGTIYQHLGIDWKQTVSDFQGRPTQLLDRGEPIQELML